MAVLSRPFRVGRPRDLASAVIALTGAVALLYYGRLFFITLATAVMLAFILEPFVTLLGRVRIPRVPASFLVCAVALLLVYLAGVGLYTQISGLVDDLPRYQQRVNDLVDKVLGRMEAMEKSVYELVVPRRFREPAQPPPPPPPPKPTRRRQVELPAPVAAPAVQEVRIRPQRPPALEYLLSHFGSLYEVVLMASFVPFLVYFMLSWQDHIQRSFLLLFEEEQARVVAANTLAGIARIVRAFVVGNFVLGLILTAASAFLFYMFWLPYPVLTGSLSGFLSLIPYIGLPLALVPPLVTALPVYNTMTPYVLISGFVAVFHLIAINVLYPKIVGPRVHLNPLVVTVALMAWSALWGPAGLILGIPLTAGIKAVCDNVAQLKPYARLLGD